MLTENVVMRNAIIKLTLIPRLVSYHLIKKSSIHGIVPYSHLTLHSYHTII